MTEETTVVEKKIDTVVVDNKKQEGNQELIKEFENIFSLKNLKENEELIKSMDDQGYIKLDVISKISTIEKISKSIDEIKTALGNVKSIQYDVQKNTIRPLKRPRTRLILRDIPEDTKEEELKKLFESNDCPQLLKLQAQHGNNWYASFSTEKNCLEAAQYVRNIKFRDNYVKCGIKSESLPTNYSNVSTQTVDPKKFYGGSQFNQFYRNPQQWGSGQQQPQQYNKFQKNGYNPHHQNGYNPKYKGNKRNYKKGKKAYNKKGKKNFRTKRQSNIQFGNMDHFPALPKKEGGVNMIKYSKDEMVEIVNKLGKEEYPMPEELKKVGEQFDIMKSKKRKTESKLLASLPLVFPASPSPLLNSMNEKHNLMASHIPFLDLSGNATEEKVSDDIKKVEQVDKKEEIINVKEEVVENKEVKKVEEVVVKKEIAA